MMNFINGIMRSSRVMIGYPCLILALFMILAIGAVCLKVPESNDNSIPSIRSSSSSYASYFEELFMHL